MRSAACCCIVRQDMRVSVECNFVLSFAGSFSGKSEDNVISVIVAALASDT